MALSELYSDGFEPVDFIPEKENKPVKPQEKKQNSAIRGNLIYYTDSGGLVKSISKKKFAKLSKQAQNQIKKAA